MKVALLYFFASIFIFGTGFYSTLTIKNYAGENIFRSFVASVISLVLGLLTIILGLLSFCLGYVSYKGRNR